MAQEEKKKDPIVYALARPSRCYGCDKRLVENDIVKLDEQKDERQVLCSNCPGLAELVALPSGNAVMTRLAKKYSKTRYVIVKWSDAWKCYERKGLLLEKHALEQAEKEAKIK